MKTIANSYFCILLFLIYTNSAKANRIITAQDSIIFDLNSSTLTATSFEFSVMLKSDDVINSFDFAFQFNTTKLTFTSTTVMVPGNNSISHTSYFSATDLYLRSTLNSLSALPNNQYILNVKFTLAAACTSLNITDFYNLSGILNGVSCSAVFRPLFFSKFIPQVSFTSTPTCFDRPTYYNSTSTITSGQLQSFLWQLTPQYTQSAQAFLYTYTVAAVHPVSLTVCSSAGCCSSLVTSSTVNPIPFVAFDYTVNCLTDSVTFLPASPIVQGSFSSFNWQFDKNGPLITNYNPVYQFPLHASYEVTLLVKDAGNCGYKTTQDVLVLPTDINQDGNTNVSDFLIISANWELQCN